MAYRVGLGDSPQTIAGYLGGNPQRYPELLAANPHKPIVRVNGRPTFASLGVGERLNVPPGFVGEALCRAFGVGDPRTAFDHLERTFGTNKPEEAFEILEEAFGVGATNSDAADFFQRVGQEVKDALPPPPKPDVTRLGDWKLVEVNRRFSSWRHKPDQDSYPSKMTDNVTTVSQAAIYPPGIRTEEQRAAHRRHYLKVLNDVRAARVHCAKTGKGCDSGGGGGLFGAMTKSIGGAASDVVEGIGQAAGAATDAVADVASSAAKEVEGAVVSAAKFVEKTGGDALKFVQRQAEKFAEDPAGALAKVASSGGLSLFGVSPEKVLNEIGIPSPDQMLKEVGVPTVSELTHESFKTVTDPTHLLDKIPGVNQITQYVPSIDPTQMAADLVNATVQGDLEGIKREALAIGQTVADITSMVPGIGNVVGGPLASAIALLETGSALKAALALLLNQVPGIPPQVRSILRAALNAIADVVENQKSITDVLLVEFREGVKEEVSKQGISGPIADLIEDLLDGAIQVIFRSKPLDKAALDLAEQGLEVAKDKVAEGIGSMEAVQEAQKTLDDLKGVYENVNEMHALTQGIQKLNRDLKMAVTPLMRSMIEKQIKDLETAIAAKNLVAQDRAKKSKKGKKRPPSLRARQAKKKVPSLRERPRPETALEKLAKLSPAEQAKLKELAALKELSPEQQKALAALSPEARAQLAALSPEERQALKPTPGTRPAAAGGPAVGPDRFGPYPQQRPSA